MALPPKPTTPAKPVVPAKPMTPAPVPVNQAKPITPAPARPMTPAPAPVMTPAMQRQQENQTFINQLNAKDGKNRLVDHRAMTEAVNKTANIKAATDARLKAEAAANKVPAKQNPFQGSHDAMQRMVNRNPGVFKNVSDVMNYGKPVTKAKGGKVRSASSRADGIAIRGKTRA